MTASEYSVSKRSANSLAYSSSVSRFSRCGTFRLMADLEVTRRLEVFFRALFFPDETAFDLFFMGTRVLNDLKVSKRHQNVTLIILQTSS